MDEIKSTPSNVVSLREHSEQCAMTRKQAQLREIINALHGAADVLESVYEDLRLDSDTPVPDKYYITIFDSDGNALNACSNSLEIEDFMMISNFVELDAEGKFGQEDDDE